MGPLTSNLHGDFSAIMEAAAPCVSALRAKSAQMERSATMLLTGKDVWDAIVKAGFLSGPYDPRTNRQCAHADVLAGLLNEVLSRSHNWLPNLIETEDAMRLWEANTPREYVLRLYKFLNQCGYTIIGIDAAIEREARRRKAGATADAVTRKTRPGIHRP
jgi:hypothetical protein